MLTKDAIIEDLEDASTKDAPKSTCTEQRQPLPLELVNTAFGQNFASDEAQTKMAFAGVG